MDFFFDVGIYALIVALTAAGAGFVAFRLFTGGGLAARSGMRRRVYRGTSTSDDGEDGEEWAAAPVRPAQSPAPKAKAQSAVKDAAVAADPPASPSQAASPAASGAKQEGLIVPESDTSEALQSFQTALSQEVNPRHQEGGDTAGHTREQALPIASGPGTENSEGPAVPKSEPEAEEAIQTVVAPPDEVDHEGSDDDSFLEMFKGGDDEESTVEGLASRLEDVDASSLLSAAMETVAALKGKGGGDA
jgi:hypothetical protein